MKTVFKVGMEVYDQIYEPDVKGEVLDVNLDISPHPITVKFGSCVRYYTAEGCRGRNQIRTLSTSPYRIEGFEQKAPAPTFEEARNYTTDSLMNNLGKFELSVQSRLKEEFKTKFFDLTTLTSGLKPPASMLKAVEDRNKAIQEANRVKNELETSRMLLEKAKIDAETNKVQSVGLTKEILMQQYIEMLGKTSNKVIITDGRTPVILGN